mgnify:FL=1
MRTNAIAATSQEGEAKQASLDARDDIGEFVDFVFDELDDLLWEGLAEVALADGPLADDVDEGFCEDDFGAGHVAEAEVGGGVFGDLLEEARLELQEVVVDSWADYNQGVVHVGQGEEGFALDVGVGDVDGVEGGGVVVEYAEEVVVVAEEIGFFLS